ncbi:MAG: AraC family transcriptional regulator [Clostridia bacterium]|nr:AraC family transcriptional regulator [Clostridia bacterium]
MAHRHIRADQSNVFRFLTQQFVIKKPLFANEKTDACVTRIAQECGFCSASYFSKSFRRYMKISPLQYRRQLENAL